MVLLAIAVVVGGGSGSALAYWTGFDTALHGTGAAAAGSVNQGAAPTADSAGTHVVLTWGASTLTNGDAVDGYLVKRYDAGTNVAQTLLSTCTGTVVATTCTERNMPPGNWKYTVTPVTAGHWRGTESAASGVVRTGTTVLSLDRSVVGAPLPSAITGTLTGFAPNEGIAFTLDGAPVAGSPSRAGADGSATIGSLTIPSGTSDGPHTIAVLGDNRDAPSHAQASILVDTVAPVITPFTTPPANAAGWSNTSPVEVDNTVDDGSGSGIAYVKYTDDGTDPTISPTARLALVPPMATQSTTYKFYGVDMAGNASAVKTLSVKIDTTPPLFTVAFVDVHGGAYISPVSPQGAPGTAYYRGAAAGSFRFAITPIPAGGSPTVSAGFTPLSADVTGVSFDSASISVPDGGPYVSNPLSWVAGTSSTPSGTITLLDAAGNSFGSAGPLVNDSIAPSGGSVDAGGLVGTGGRYSGSLNLSLSLAQGTDAGSGLADGSAATDIPAQLLRASAPLTSGDGVANGTCGTYGAYAQVGGDSPTPAVADTVPADLTCYRYRYVVPDHVGNLATYESPDIKVMTTTVASVRPTDATITPVSGIGAQSASGSIVYYNPALLGSFNVDSSASSPVVGISQMTFPALAGFTGGGVQTTPSSGTTYRATYAWSGNGSSASPGVQSLSATNNAGSSRSNGSAFSVVKDDVAPSGGAADATGLGGTGGRYATSTTLSIALAPGTDAGSGLAASGRVLLRASASLTSDGVADGTCGSYGAYTQVGAADPASPATDTVPVDRTCYRYRYVVSDNVGNQTTYTSPDVKVDTAAPPAPALGISNLSNASSTGAAVFYRPAAVSGGFTITASSADATSGTTGYGFPTLPTGWSASSGGLGIRTYSWSSPNPTVPSGAQSVTTTNNAGGQASSSFTVTVSPDSTPPSGGSITYTNGYSTVFTVAFSKGTDSGSGLAAASGLLQRSSATLSNGACGSFDAFVTVATNPSSPTTDPVTGGCYQYRYLISDNVGNQAVYTSPSIVKFDQFAPTSAISIINVTGGAFSAFGGTTLYYKGDAAGSFKYVDTMTDAESGPASATFPDIATTGWVHSLETVTTPAGSPYVSSTYSWSANPSNPTPKTIVGKDAAGRVSGPSITYINDVTPPAGSSITSTNALLNAASVPISLVNGSDAGSGIDPATAIIRRDVASLSTATETCGTFAGTYAATVTLVGGADTSVSSGNCYRYEYTLSDHVGNTITTTSASVAKIDTSGPRVTAIASLQSDSSAGNGQLQVGDKLVLTFNQSLVNASVPTTFSGATETSPGSGVSVKLTIPGITTGPLDTGSLLYVPVSSTATFGGTISLSNNGASTTVTLSVTSLSGAATAASSGVLVFAPASTIHDGGGNSAGGTFSTPSAFKLF
jgi:hypothetical protein